MKITYQVKKTKRWRWKEVIDALTKEIPEYVIAVSPTSYATELDADHAYHRARISFMQETSRVSIGQAASLEHHDNVKLI